MTHDHIYDKIEAWLSGELSEAEASAFEKEIEADPALAKEVERHRIANQVTDRLVQLNMLENFKKWQESMEEIPPPPRKFSLKKIYFIALLLVVLAGGLLLCNNKKFIKHIIKTIIPPVPENSDPSNVLPSPIPSDAVAVEPIDTSSTTTTKSSETLEKKPTQAPPQSQNSALIALADARLKGLKESILLQYGQTMGEEDEENLFFEQGLEAFKNNKPGEVIKTLEQIKNDDPFFIAAQEILAVVYFSEKKYLKAINCYEIFAKENPFPEVDWRLAQFYLADYPTRKNDFWKKIEEITSSSGQHRYKEDANKLILELKEKGISK